jgi:hypothetical protein
MKHFASRAFWEAYDRLPKQVRDLADRTVARTKNPRGSVVTRNGAGRPPIDQKLRIFARTFVAPFQSVAPFRRIFSRRETRQGQNRDRSPTKCGPRRVGIIVVASRV